MMSESERGWLSLGRSYLKAGRAKEALLTLRQARRADPSSPRIDRWLGAAAQQCEEDDEAIAAYERALAQKADDLEVVVNLAELYLNRVQVKKAAVLLERALQLDPQVKHPAGVRARVLIMKAKKQAGR
jgi:cytochrome c-type biogenesis protein CcmH/NrfG